MGKIVAILWVLVILFGAFWLVYYQEGANRDITIEMDGRMTMRGMPIQFNMDKLYASGGKLALDFELKSGRFNSRGKLICDTDKKEQIMVFDAIKAYTKTSFELVDKTECEPAKTMLLMEDEESKRLPDSKTIAGYRCHAFGSTKKSRETGTAWFTYELRLGRSHVSLVNKLIRIKSEEGFFFGWGSSEKKREQCSGFDYFPFPLSARFRMNGAQLAVEVKSISRVKIDKSVFAVPSGYKEISSQEMQKRMSGGSS
jgi:hypothetical protein